MVVRSCEVVSRFSIARLCSAWYLYTDSLACLLLWQRYPRAILVYVDLTGLHAWRTAAPTDGRPNQLVWSAMWEAAPACTAQLQVRQP